MVDQKKFLDYEGVRHLWSKINMQDYPNNKTLMAVINAIDETKADKTDIVQSDWNQNDPEAADYVKNRPFYTGDPVETVLVEESTVPFEDGGGVYIAIWPESFEAVEGQTYTVKFDGTEYSCVCQIYEGSSIVIGNLSIAGAGDDSGEPFIIINQGSWMTRTSDTSASHVISISKSVQEVKKIDSKYIDFPAETDPTVPAWAKDDHKPTYTASEVGALPSDTVIPVIITYDASGNLSHTFSQIQTLISNGKTCIVLDKKNGVSYLYFGNGSNYINFRNSNKQFSISESGTVSITDPTIYDLPVASSTTRGGIRLGDGLKIKELDSDVVSVSDDYVNTLIDEKLAEEIPTELPNPAALTFTGAVTGSYDGSEAVTVEIPSGGSAATGAVKYDTAQDLTTEQQETARSNIGAQEIICYDSRERKLTFNGNLDGKTYIEINGLCLVKISDIHPTADELLGGRVSSTENGEDREDEITEYSLDTTDENVILGMEHCPFVSVLADAVIDGVALTPGFWVIYIPDVLTVHYVVYVSTDGELQRIPAKYVPTIEELFGKTLVATGKTEFSTNAPAYISPAQDTPRLKAGKFYDVYVDGVLQYTATCNYGKLWGWESANEYLVLVDPRGSGYQKIAECISDNELLAITDSYLPWSEQWLALEIYEVEKIPEKYLENAVTSVNGKKGNVTLSADDVGALPADTEIPVVPDALPNPSKLILTGAVEAEYDGSQEVTVEIPAGGSGGSGGIDLGITGATVGQIAKITAVDDEGKPTAWEPVALAEAWEHICDISVSGKDEINAFTQEFDVPYKKLRIVRLATATAPTTGTSAGGLYWSVACDKDANNNNQTVVWMFDNDTWVTHIVECELLSPNVTWGKAYTSVYSKGFRGEYKTYGLIPEKGFSSIKIGANKLFNDGTFRIYGVRA